MCPALRKYNMSVPLYLTYFSKLVLEIIVSLALWRWIMIVTVRRNIQVDFGYIVPCAQFIFLLWGPLRGLGETMWGRSMGDTAPKDLLQKRNDMHIILFIPIRFRFFHSTGRIGVFA